MATDNRNNGKGGNNNGKREPLVLLHGDPDNNGNDVSLVHTFLRPIVWGLIWYLNGLLLQSIREKGKARFQTEERLIGRVLCFVAAAKSNDMWDRTRRGWIELLASENPEQVKVLDEAARTLDCPTILFDRETGAAENMHEAALRLINAAVLHPNKFIAASFGNFANALVEANLLSAEKAGKVIEAAIAERDGIKKEDQAA